MSTVINTRIYQISPATYLRVVAGSSIPSLLATIILVSFVSIGAGIIFDTRIILVSLILIFLVFPYFIYYIYFTRLLTVEAQYAVCPKKVTLDLGRIITETFHSNDESKIPPTPRTRQWIEIKQIHSDRRNVMIYFQDRTIPLIIPIDSLPENCSVSSLLEFAPQQTN